MIRHAESLTLEFFDRTRLATWVRDHPRLIPWVREKIGRAIPGWRPYGPWAYAPEGVTGEYLFDDRARIQTGRKEDGEGLSALEGIKRMRDILRAPGKVVRLVGLSGVGKTRLVEALFDERVDGQTLDPSLAFYTNMADGPDPQPTGLASDLIAARTRVILVVDNCPPELHCRLSELCRSPGSTVSVVTVEYDIREDEPEGTDVFALEPSSSDLVEKLVKHRFPEISSVDAHSVAEFSGGNARIAIALAATIGKNETIAGLNDEELFERLFEQRHGTIDVVIFAKGWLPAQERRGRFGGRRGGRFYPSRHRSGGRGAGQRDRPKCKGPPRTASGIGPRWTTAMALRTRFSRGSQGSGGGLEDGRCATHCNARTSAQRSGALRIPERLKGEERGAFDFWTMLSKT